MPKSKNVNLKNHLRQHHRWSINCQTNSSKACPFNFLGLFAFLWVICLALTKNTYMCACAICTIYLFKENRHLCSILWQLPNMSIAWHMESRLWRHTMQSMVGSSGSNTSARGIGQTRKQIERMSERCLQSKM